MNHHVSHPDGGSIGLRLALSAMGTRFELLLTDDRDEHELRAAGESALEIIQDWHDRLSIFDKGSLVSRINTEAQDQPVRIDHDLLDLLKACQRWHSMTEGAFDIAVGSLMEHYGFRDASPTDRIPPYGMGRFEIDEDAMTVRFTEPGVKLDFGAVGKGWAIDRALEALREAGVTSALLHGGTSTVGSIGTAPGGDPWRVRIEDDEHAPIALLADASLSVSAPSGRVNEAQEGHVLDPRTGKPSAGARLAAVIAVYSGETDALSTALVVLGARPGSISQDVVSILPAQGSTPGGWAVAGSAAGRVIVPDSEHEGQQAS